MRYVRKPFDYFRETDERIETAKELSILAKEQANRETVNNEQTKPNPLLFIFSAVIVIAIISLIYTCYKAVSSMDNPDDIFENPVTLYIFFGAFMLVGILFAFYPIITNIRLKIKCKEETSARCVGFNDKSVVTKHSSYVTSCPVYRFTDNGQEFTVYNGKHLRNSGSFPLIGDTVSINYDPANPDNCIIDGKLNWYLPALIIGVAFIAIAIAVLVGCILYS